MFSFIIDSIKRLVARAASLFSVYVVGLFRGYNKAENDAVKKENKKLRSNVGVSDSDLSKRLRERAKRKDRD